MPKGVYDLVIIGGGISGVGVALAAAKNGVSVALLEKADTLSATSSNSLRIIHGGYRYLQTLNFRRIRDSIIARNQLLKDYPEFIKIQPCVFALNAVGMKSYWPVSAANFLFNTLEQFFSGKRGAAEIRPADWAEKHAPLLAEKARHGVLVWDDAIISDLPGFHARLKQELLALGVEVITDSPVLSVSRAASGYQVDYQHQSNSRKLEARSVVNCSGPWSEQIQINLADYTRPSNSWCRAFNVVINRRLDFAHAIGVETRSEGKKRLVFITPRPEGSAIGTEYLPFEGAPDQIKVSESEIAAFVDLVNDSLPELKIRLSEVSSVDAGILPLAGRNAGMQLLSRERTERLGNYFDYTAVKYTTFLVNGRQLAGKICKILAQ